MINTFITIEQMNQVIKENDLDSAIFLVQKFISQDDGGIAGIHFSKYDNADLMWQNSNIEEREKIINEYLSTEESYKNL